MFDMAFCLQDGEMLTEVTAKLGDFGVAKVGSWSKMAASWRNFYRNDRSDLFNQV